MGYCRTLNELNKTLQYFDAIGVPSDEVAIIIAQDLFKEFIKISENDCNSSFTLINTAGITIVKFLGVDIFLTNNISHLGYVVRKTKPLSFYNLGHYVLNENGEVKKVISQKQDIGNNENITWEIVLRDVYHPSGYPLSFFFDYAQKQSESFTESAELNNYLSSLKTHLT